jgi:hypothetical protein
MKAGTEVAVEPEVEMERSPGKAAPMANQVPQFKPLTVVGDPTGLLWLPSWFKRWIVRLFG